MEDQALQHVMNIQTQMLQNLTRLQQDQQQNQIGAPLAQQTDMFFSTPMPNSIASPTTPPSAYPGMSINDPTKYGAHAEPYFVGDRPGYSVFEERGFIGGTLAEIREFDGYRRSKEDTEQFVLQQSRAVQERAVSVFGGAATGAATAGSFFIPGLIPGLAAGIGVAAGVGGTVSSISGGAKQALDYQEVLQKQSYRFMNAFESTSDFGGIGLGLEDRQEISGFLRDLAPERFLEDREMMSILEGATDNRLMRTVTDVKSFKDKFSEVVDAVKEITVTMNQTIEEATEFMGEMERRGIATKDMSFIASQSKVMSAHLGIDASLGSQMLMQGTDNLVSGTGINAGNVMQSTTRSTILAQELQDWARDNDPAMYDYIRNMGGAESIGPRYDQSLRNYINSSDGTGLLTGFFVSAMDFNRSAGTFDINHEEMSELLSGNVSVDEMRNRSQIARNQLSAVERKRLQDTIGTSFNNYASDSDLASFARRSAELYIESQRASGHELDMETALMEMGLAGDFEQASYINRIIEMAEDSNMSQLIHAQVMKESADSREISNNPGMFKRLGFWFDRNVTNKFGDVGQGVSDSVGRSMLNYQRFITGIDSQSMVGGEVLQDFSRAGLLSMIEGTDQFNQSQQELNQYLFGESPRGATDYWSTGLGTSEEELSKIIDGASNSQLLDNSKYSFYKTQLNRGALSGVDLASLKEEDLGFMENINYQLLANRAKGRYDSFLGKIDYGIDLASVRAVEYATEAGKFLLGWDNLKSYFDGSVLTDMDHSSDLEFSNLEDQAETLQKIRKEANQDVMKLFLDGNLDLSKSEQRKLEEMIKEGDTSGVSRLTNDPTARELANKYKELQGKEEVYSDNLKEFSDWSRYTKGFATAGSQLGSLLADTGLYDEGMIDLLVGDLRDDGKKAIKKIADGKWSVQEMAAYNLETTDNFDAVFKALESNADQLAEHFASRDQGLKISALYEDGTDRVSIDKLREYIMNNLIRDAHVGGLGYEGGSGAQGAATSAASAAEENTEAVYTFLSAYQQNTRMIRDVLEGNPVTRSNTTSLSSNRVPSGAFGP